MDVLSHEQHSFMNLNVVGDDSNIVGVDLELEGEVAEGVRDRLKVVLHSELLPGVVDDRLDLRNLVRVHFLGFNRNIWLFKILC